MHLIYAASIHILQHVHTCTSSLSKTAQTKVIWLNNWEILSFRPKFHFQTIFFHISRNPNAPRFMGKTYTLEGVHMCPLVSSEYSIK